MPCRFFSASSMIEVTLISVLLELENSLTAKQERRTFYARRNPIEVKGELQLSRRWYIPLEPTITCTVKEHICEKFGRNE